MIRPPLLKTGDKIAIVSPSRMITQNQLVVALEVLDSWGLEVVLGDHIYDSHGYFAGADVFRLNDLQRAIDDQEIKAIFCSRGGYGMSRILDQINVQSLLNNPKWIIGFSDITAIHIKLNCVEVESIHGLMPVQFEYKGIENSLESLQNLLFNGKVDYKVEGNDYNRRGKATGEVIGGNLSLLIDSLGTSSEIDTAGKILFIEEIDEYLYKVDRMFNHLKRTSKLNKISGLIVGNFSQMKDTTIPFGKNVEELILDYTDLFNGPVVFNFPIGHEAFNLAIPCGRNMTLEVNEKGAKLFDWPVATSSRGLND
jgi:muramoyltetrapeptide carboxypeptidase